MKEPVNIDLLFQKAASTPVHTSFDAAKETFTHSLANRGSGGKKFFRSLKWILMTTLILGGITAIAIAFLPGEKPEQEQIKIAATASEVNVSDEVIEEARIAEDEDQQKLTKIEFDGEMKPLPLPMLSYYLKQPRQLFFAPEKWHYTFADDLGTKTDSVVVPTLTSEEISDNHKRKKKMMKALAKQDDDHYVYIPSGSTTYKETPVSVQAFFMQVNEVSNEQYRTFLNDLLIQGRTDEYIQAYPQEDQWSEQIDGDVIAMESLYFTHPAYDEYPVVNVTRKGAEMYCDWLTLETSNSKFVDGKMMLNDVRLPQRPEWVYAATGGERNNEYPWGGPSTQNEKECYLANYKPDSLNYFEDGAFFTAKTETYLPNKFGLYNMSGNVAEMVYGSTEFSSKSDLIEFKTDAGTAGGGWMDDAETLKIEGDDPYSSITEGHPNIGFRVVMTYFINGNLVGQKGN